jgi:hypothetical protein
MTIDFYRVLIREKLRTRCREGSLAFSDVGLLSVNLSMLEAQSDTAGMQTIAPPNNMKRASC